ncbi:MAG: UDP-N-acetylmuramate--alanine ligase [Alphaproteobacteria bacterium]|nr:UDP-N-acetylmuramate--alanine ligase [Alphaproteobacteria bacterium]
MTKVGFCGISGSGMSSLAQILKLSGYEVCGSDRNFDLGRDLATKEKMQKMGISIYPQDGSWIDSDLKWLCASTAVEDTIPDVKAAKEKNVPIITRPQLLADTFHSYHYGIAVGGTSGKTTTTAMIGYILDKAGKKPCMINGGLLRDYEGISAIPNIIYNKGDICVVEADESNGSIDLYNPYIALITNISADHKSLEELSFLFQNFANRTQKSVIINDDYELCRNLKINKPVLTFSTQNPKADFCAYNITPLAHGTQYDFDGKTYTLNLIGEFNIANALAAIAACAEMGLDRHTAAEILQGFHGTKRRLEVIGQRNNITVIDDFAHNPDKIKASITALRRYNGRLIVMFQPHGFAPMRSLGKEIMSEFTHNMNDEDILIMPEIFFVGGTVAKDISSKNLIDYAVEQGKNNAFFVPDKASAMEKILQFAQSGDRIVIMGARDNSLTDFCRQILEKL